MPFLKTEGIILQAVKYRDNDLILTVFTEAEGIVGLIWKRAFSARNHRAAAAAPLTLAEFVYSRGKGSLLTCQEMSPLQGHSKLRQDLSWLEAGADLARTLRQSLPEHKPAPALYHLLIAFLEKIPTFVNPTILATSFRLKILRHEGVLPFEAPCTLCYRHSTGRSISPQGSFCLTHRPHGGICFAPGEEEIIQHLTYSLSFQSLRTLLLDDTLSKRIAEVFGILIQHH